MVAVTPTAAPSRETRYTRVAIALHWVLAVIIIAEIAGGKIMTEMPATTLKFEIYQWHKSFGLVVLALSAFRLLWRLSHPVPALPGGMKPWERWAAHGTHVAFYVFMIGVPLLGWLMVSASNAEAIEAGRSGLPTRLFDLFVVPDLPGSDAFGGSAKLWNRLHAIAGTLFGGLVLVHIGAALKHQFIAKDNLLARMIPRLRTTP